MLIKINLPVNYYYQVIIVKDTVLYIVLENNLKISMISPLLLIIFRSIHNPQCLIINF